MTDYTARALWLKDRVLQRLLLRVRPAFLAPPLKRALGVRRTVIETQSGKFFVDPVSGLGAMLQAGLYEPSLVLAIWSLLEPGGCFVDVGANEGYFSVIGARLVGPNGRVIAVEPQRRIRSVLEKNFELNGVSNVTIVDAAISDRHGSADLHISPDINTGSTALSQTTQYATRTETIETITLSELFAAERLERVDLMKMDIEGHEYEAILGSAELFREGRVRALALELHGRALSARGHAPEEIVSFLKSCGYRMASGFEQTLDNSVWLAPPL